MNRRNRRLNRSISPAATQIAAFVDDVIESGGRVVAAGNEPLLANPEAALVAFESDACPAAKALLDCDKSEPAKVGRVRRRTEELSFEEATRAWDDHPIQELLEYSARAIHDSGLAVVDAPSEFASASTALAAAGAGIIIHITSDGVPVGHPVVPVVKVTGNSETAAALPNDIDVNAGTDDSGALRQTIESGTQQPHAGRGGAEEILATPTVSTDIIRTGNRYGTPVIPGVMAPTEALTAIESGADLCKLFPVSRLEPSHVSAI